MWFKKKFSNFHFKFAFLVFGGSKESSDLILQWWKERIMAEVFQKGSSGSDWTYMAWVDITLSVWRYTMLTNRCYFLISVLLLNIILLFKTSISITWRKIVSIINSVLFFFFFMYHVDFFSYFSAFRIHQIKYLPIRCLLFRSKQPKGSNINLSLSDYIYQDATRCRCILLCIR